MKAAADLFARLDDPTGPDAKIAALLGYFQTAPDGDKLWTVALLSGRTPKRIVTANQLRAWAIACAGLKDWLFEDSYRVVGDLSETIALVLPPPSRHENHSLTHWIKTIKRLSRMDEETRKSAILNIWDGMPAAERFWFIKLLTGGLRAGTSESLLIRALAQLTGQDEPAITYRLNGTWSPDTTTWHNLIEASDPQLALSHPYPFQPSQQVENIADLGNPAEWQATHAWGGARCQFILRGGSHALWSQDGALITDQVPELAPLRDFLPDGTVIEGALRAFAGDAPLGADAVHARITRKKITKAMRAETQLVLIANDLLEHDGSDLRQSTLDIRHKHLKNHLTSTPDQLPLRLSSAVEFASWSDLETQRQTARTAGADGLLLRHRDSPYLASKTMRWIWNAPPLTVDAVLIYAQAGPQSRANLFTEFTFAVWNGQTLTPFTRTSTGLTDADLAELSTWVRKNTQSKFGPVRQVTPTHVFEIAFDDIHASPRHKSGVALRFPRVLRWHKDKPVTEANTLDDLKDMRATYG